MTIPLVTILSKGRSLALRPMQPSMLRPLRSHFKKPHPNYREQPWQQHSPRAQPSSTAIGMYGIGTRELKTGFAVALCASKPRPRKLLLDISFFFFFFFDN